MVMGFARAEKAGTILAALAVIALAILLATGRAAHASEPIQVRLFGSVETANPDISPFPKWTGMLARYAGERHLEDAPCAGGRCPLQRWKAFVTSLRGQDRLRQLEAVNAYVNRTPYQADSERFGVVDHWTTPREFLGRAGDCEDYAIAKYLSLRKLGWQPGELRLLVLMDESRRELHAVLVAYVGGTAYVLDNLGDAVRQHAAIRHYRPIFSINEAGWYYHRDWNPAAVAMVGRPDRAGTGRGRADGVVPDTQIAGTVPPALDTTRRGRAPQAARSYSGGPRESMAALFANGGAER